MTEYQENQQETVELYVEYYDELVSSWSLSRRNGRRSLKRGDATLEAAGGR